MSLTPSPRCTPWMFLLMLLTEDVHQRTALPDRPVCTGHHHAPATSRGSGSPRPRHLCPAPLQVTRTPWSQPHQHHRPRSRPPRSGWAGAPPQRRPPTALRPPFLKPRRRRALDTAREPWAGRPALANASACRVPPARRPQCAHRPGRPPAEHSSRNHVVDLVF